MYLKVENRHQPPTTDTDTARHQNLEPKNNFIKEIANKSATGVHMELPSHSRLRRAERYGFSNYVQIFKLCPDIYIMSRYLNYGTIN